MRIITWNMGCFFGQRYRTSNARTWQQLLAWDPDVALVQETLRPPLDAEDGRFVFTPYGHTDQIGTLIYSKRGGLEPVTTRRRFGDVVAGQVTLASLTVDGAEYLLSSIHAVVDAVTPERLEGMDVKGLSSWHGKNLYSLDLILDDLRPLTEGRRFVVGGDLNCALRWDAFYGRTSSHSGYSNWFLKSRDAAWIAAHAKFHAGEERTCSVPVVTTSSTRWTTS
jgi:hypothetical protein